MESPGKKEMYAACLERFLEDDPGRVSRFEQMRTNQEIQLRAGGISNETLAGAAG